MDAKHTDVPGILSSIAEQVTVLLLGTKRDLDAIADQLSLMLFRAKCDLRDRLQYIDGIIYLGRDPDDDERCPACGSYRYEMREFTIRGGGTTEVRCCTECDRPFDERGLVLCRRS